MNDPSPIPFAEWVRKVFDHPVTDPAWHWDIDSDTSEPAAEECVAHLTRLFEESGSVLAPYSDAQLNQGFWFLVSNSCSNYMFSLLAPEVAWPQRQRCLQAIALVFEQVFARRCSEHLSHCDEKGASPLNSICYMWWDVIPVYGRPEDPTYTGVDAEVLEVLRRTLALDSLACQESALHGLGHWYMEYPEVVESIVDDFLRRCAGKRERLRSYAEAARCGCVQ